MKKETNFSPFSYYNVNVILYSRVSTDEQAEKGHSLAYQESALRAYCAANNHNVLASYREDFTAKHFDRPAWKQILHYIKENRGAVDCILFLRWDRFARTLLGALLMIDKLHKKGVRVNSTENPIDTENPDQLILLSTYLVLPQIENEKNSQRTTEGSRKARLEGCWTGTAPLGYENWRNESGKSTLIPDDKAKVVKRIFDDMATGVYSAEELWVKYKKAGEVKLSKQGFLNLLRNVVYLGKIQVKAWKKLPEEIAIGLHPPVVSEDVFYRVQRLLEKKRSSPKIHKKNVCDQGGELAYYLKGRLSCPTHHRSLTASASKGRTKHYHYYHCSDSRCSCRYSVDAIHSHMDSVFASIKVTKSVLTAYEKMLAQVFEKADVYRKEELAKTLKELEETRTKKTRLVMLLLEDKFPAEQYTQTSQMLESTIKALETNVAILQDKETPHKQLVKRGFNLLSDMAQSYRSYPPVVKEKVVGSIFPEKLVFDGEKVRTARINAAVALFDLKINGLEIEEKEKAGDFSGFVKEAPPAGLEPATL